MSHFPGWEPLRFDHPTMQFGYDTILLEEAIRAARRVGEASPRARLGAAAAAVLCAAAACEARMSEYLAMSEIGGTRTHPEIERLRREPDAARQWKRLLRLVWPKFDLAGRLRATKGGGATGVRQGGRDDALARDVRWPSPQEAPGSGAGGLPVSAREPRESPTVDAPRRRAPRTARYLT